MTEKMSINGKDIWIMVDAIQLNRSNPNVIPTEYFTASYRLQEPDESPGILFIKEDGTPVLFESPVAALEFANEKLLALV